MVTCSPTRIRAVEEDSQPVVVVVHVHKLVHKEAVQLDTAEMMVGIAMVVDIVDDPELDMKSSLVQQQEAHT